MRAALCFIASLLALCLLGCSRDYTPKEFWVVSNEMSRRVPGALVNREFFPSSNTRPLLGRFFADDEFQADRSAVAVISHDAWQNMFRSRPEIVGSRVQLDGRQTMIIGVAPSDFSPVGAGEFWIPKL